MRIDAAVVVLLGDGLCKVCRYLSLHLVVGRRVKVLCSHGVVAVLLEFSLQGQAWGHPG